MSWDLGCQSAHGKLTPDMDQGKQRARIETVPARVCRWQTKIAHSPVTIFVSNAGGGVTCQSLHRATSWLGPEQDVRSKHDSKTMG